MGAIRLPKFIRNYFNGQVNDLFNPERKMPGVNFDFKSAKGEAALYDPDSIAWQAYKNPVTVFIGGVSAVCLQLAEPRVRTGVWENSSFRENARGRIQRTGLAAMMTVYGPKDDAAKMIELVNRMHAKVTGTVDGKDFSANDPDLLKWVFDTANHEFLSAYDRFGPGASKERLDEGLDQAADRVAHLWGVEDAVRSTDEALESYRDMELEAHPILDEFISIVKKADLMPWYMNPVQRLLVRAAVSNLPEDVRAKVGIEKYGLNPGEETLVKMMGKLADRVYLEALPAVQASERMGLPADYLYNVANNNDDFDHPEHRPDLPGNEGLR